MKVVSTIISIFMIVLFVQTIHGKQRDGTINEYFADPNNEYSSDEYEMMKRDLIKQYGIENLQKVFQNVRKTLDAELQTIKRSGNAIIPTIDFNQIASNGENLPPSVAETVKKRGVLIIRNTMDKHEATALFDDVIEYMQKNGVYPPSKTSQSVFEIYWSKSQMKARQHPNMIKAQKALLNLWHYNNSINSETDPETFVDLSQPVMYIDRLRVRPPGDFWALPIHADSGSIERWKDKNYRQVYRHILEGTPELYDPHEINHRIRAEMKDPSHPNGCTFFRAFQGWLSLTPSGPKQGTLRVLPLLKETTAYWMLRALQPDVPKDLFPGCTPGTSFLVSPKWHADIFDHLVSLPEINPGDTVWWHADTIHSVEAIHRGKYNNSVLYIPAGPDCAMNREYLAEMKRSFLEGRTPPDFPSNDYETKYQDRATTADVTEMGKRMMGFASKESNREYCEHKMFGAILEPNSSQEATCSLNP